MESEVAWTPEWRCPEGSRCLGLELKREVWGGDGNKAKGAGQPARNLFPFEERLQEYHRRGMGGGGPGERPRPLRSHVGSILGCGAHLAISG